MPTFEEENPVDGNEEVIAPNDVLDVIGINVSEYLPRLDSFFDNLDAQAASFSSLTTFQSVVDQAAAAETAYQEGFLAAKKPEPRQTETVTVTAPRERGLSLPRGGGGLASLLSQQQRSNIRQNLKAIFVGITDAEIDALLAQVQNSPTAMLQLASIGNVPTRTVNGQTVATLRNSQQRTINRVLLSLNTPQSISAMNRFGAAILSGRIRIIRG